MLLVRFTVGMQVHVKPWNKKLFEEWCGDNWSFRFRKKRTETFYEIFRNWVFQKHLEVASFTSGVDIFVLSLRYQNNIRSSWTHLNSSFKDYWQCLNPLNTELNPICYLLALLGAHHFLHVSRVRVKLLTFRRLMSYIYGAPILDVSRSHTTTQHSR